MSKSVRRGRDHDINVFNTSAQVTSQEATDAIFSSGTLDIAEHRQVAKPISIFDIYPDFTQPRRIIPSAIRHLWTGEPETLVSLFDVWIQAVESEKKDYFDVKTHLTQIGTEDFDESKEMPDETGPLEKALLSVARLAANIRQVGLTNPITVVHTGRKYRLETGERRWIAYHLLNTYFPDGQWSKIPARLVDQMDVWRQAGENNARADLNAISKARQLAILIMDLLKQEGFEFRSFDDIINMGLPERAYYAQVADGNKFRIPLRQSEKILTAIGLKSAGQIRHYRMLLKLDDEAWHYADDHNLTEWEIRNFDKESVTGVTVSTRETVTGVTVSDESNPFIEPINKKRIGKIWSYAARLDILNDQDKEKALQTIEEHKRWLEELEHALRDDRKWNGR